MKEFIRFSFVLGLICLITGSLLSIVNLFTQPKIKQQKIKAEQEALVSVLPEASEFKKTEGKDFDYYVGLKDKKIIGFVLKSSKKGYASDIEILTGVDTNLDTVNVKILSQSETPGLGNRIEEKRFLDQFSNKKLSQLSKLDAITGATISSKAVIDSVDNTLEEFKDYLRELNNAR